jgi:DNA-binding beta-propeller fold protein YncE
VGEIVETKMRKYSKILAVMIAGLSLLAINGCGGSSSGANVETISLTSSLGGVIILGQTTNLTATVTGPSTNTDVNWLGCTFTTTTVTGTTSKTSTAATCPSSNVLGQITNEEATGSAVYQAPSTLPDQTTYPGLQIIITVQAQAATSKKATVTLTLDSGIAIQFTPATATLSTGEPQTFNAVLTNDLQSKGVTWLITQGVPTATIPYPQQATCSPACGTLTGVPNASTVVYTAPTTLPTTTTLTLVATAVADNSRYTFGTITLIAGGPISFNGITPTIAPQGATYWDVYLDAPNMTSASSITLTSATNGTTKLDSSSGQIKVIFPLPTSTTANPSSSGARLRLNAANLQNADTVTISVSDQAETVTNAPGGVFTYSILPVRPTVVASVPDDVPLGALTDPINIPITLDGGYFGPGSSTNVRIFFQGNALPQIPASSTARQLAATFPRPDLNTGTPGLYELSVASNETPQPSPNNPAVTNLALFPDYSSAKPALSPNPVPAGMNPGAIDIDSTLGVLAVAETGSNAIEFFSIGQGTLTSLGKVTSATYAGVTINFPTGISVNQTNHSVAVVNYGDQTVAVLPIPTAPAPAVTPFSVDLSGALQGSVSPAPLPYSIGVDPDTNLALVAYSSTSTSSVANLGFVVNLNPAGSTNPYGCLFATGMPPTPTGQCISSQVTLNTGAYPQVAVAPHGHIAFVTPGGSGVVRGVDLTKPSTSTAIANVSLAASLVTVTTSTAHTLTPGNSGTVLITGVPKGANGTDFNGVFTVSAISNTQFTYVLNSTATDSATGNASSFVYYNTPNFVFSISSTTQGIAINPITNTAALADANATGTNGPQIDLLNALDQSISSISFFAGCNAYTLPGSCSNAPELLATTSVAWQPYSNALVSYNPLQKLISVSNPVAFQNIPAQRYASVGVTGTGGAQLAVQNGTNNLLTIFGGVAVDPSTNQAFVLESGATPQTPATSTPGQIEIINLGVLKPVQISEVVVPSATPGPGIIGGIPNALVPQGTLTSATALAGVQIFGSGFAAGAQVRLDGTAIPGGNVTVVNSRLITATIPASFLSAPHHYALDVVSGGVQSNASEFLVIQSVDLSKVCTGGTTSPMPNSVAIADQLANGPFSPIAVITNSGCNSISVIDINPANGTFGMVQSTIAVGTNPAGIAISKRHGLAIVANNISGSGTASIVDLVNKKLAVPDVSVGSSPMGVGVDEDASAAVVANNASNSVSVIDLTPLFPAAGGTVATTLTANVVGGIQEPIAVAIDPDRGTNNQGIAVISAVELSNGQAPFGALAVVDLGLVNPTLSTTLSTGSVTATPTGVVFDPTAVTNTQNQGLFYANSSGSNVISAFNPDSGSAQTISVGINPTALTINPQTGAILTANSGSNTISVVDTLSAKFETRNTLGIPSSPQFAVAIDQFTNLAVIVDQVNNRVLLFPMPN